MDNPGNPARRHERSAYNNNYTDDTNGTIHIDTATGALTTTPTRATTNA